MNALAIGLHRTDFREHVLCRELWIGMAGTAGGGQILFVHRRMGIAGWQHRVRGAMATLAGGDIAVAMIVRAAMDSGLVLLHLSSVTSGTELGTGHGVDGSANTPMGRNMKIRSLKSPEDIKASDATLFKQTKEGVGRMPAYAGKLTDAQIRAVVAHIRRLQK